jgi:hypothetical protein
MTEHETIIRLCVSEWERERQRDSETETERDKEIVRQRESVCVCVCEREREKDIGTERQNVNDFSDTNYVERRINIAA